MLKSFILALQIIGHSGQTDDTQDLLSQPVQQETDRICTQMHERILTRSALIAKKIKPTSLFIGNFSSDDHLLTPEAIQTAQLSPKLQLFIDKMKQKQLNNIVIENNDEIITLHPVNVAQIMHHGTTQELFSSSELRSFYEAYEKTALKQLLGYKAPDEEALKKMGYVTRKSWEVSTDGNNAFRVVFQKTGANPQKPKTQDFTQALKLMEQDPQVQKCARLIAQELKKQGYYQQLKDCHAKNDPQIQKDATKMLYAAAGMFININPKNWMRPTFNARVLGLATIYAGHPQSEAWATTL